MATNLTLRGLEPDGVTSPNTKAPSSSVRAMRTMCEVPMVGESGDEMEMRSGGVVEPEIGGFCGSG